MDLSRIEILVLDEADRMLDMGFIRDIRRILALLPTHRQNLLFSATFSKEIRELAHSFLSEPAVVEVARRNAPSELVNQVVHPVDAGRKRELLAHLIGTGGWAQVLVFTRTKHGANRLAEQLRRDDISADAIHGNKSQDTGPAPSRTSKPVSCACCVATDLAARGLDIEELPHVVNYDLSHVPEDYVHRIGRTGRAGVEGEAVSLVCAEDRSLLAAIERLLGRSIEQRVVAGFEPAKAPQRAQRNQRPAPARTADRGAARRAQHARRRDTKPASGQRAVEGTGNASRPKSAKPGRHARSEPAAGKVGPRSGPAPAGANGNSKRPAAPEHGRTTNAKPAGSKKRGAFAALLARVIG